MKKNKLLSLISYLSHNFFIITLVLYLALFLLENIFTGFVSNNFDLNIILIPLFILGVLTAIFPQLEALPQITKPSMLDYLLIGIFTELTFFIVWYKLIDLGNISIYIAIGSSLIVLFVSILMLFFPEEEITAIKTVNQKQKKLKIFKPKKFNYLFVVVVFCLFIPLLIYFSISAKKRQTSVQVKQEHKFISVQIINEGAPDNEVSSIKAYIQSLGFTVEKVSSSEAKNNLPVLEFDSADAEIAQYLEKSLVVRYPLLEKLPLPDTADPYPHLILILVGK